MQHFSHASGSLYQIMDGVRRAKAAQLFGHSAIDAEVVDTSGQSLGAAELPIDALRSPKAQIRRITKADETRWKRAVAGAKKSALSYPPIVVQPCTERGTRVEDVDFDFGVTP
jgi:hypothetical protein